MISKFTILYNRTRQAVITGELVEIITVCDHSITCADHANIREGCRSLRGWLGIFKCITTAYQQAILVCRNYTFSHPSKVALAHITPAFVYRRARILAQLSFPTYIGSCKPKFPVYFTTD